MFQGDQDWLRVVAVITNGEEWEFQGSLAFSATIIQLHTFAVQR